MATGRVPTTANSPLTAKGDLFGYSTTQARVAVGANGETLVADSSATTGLRWQGNYASGKNSLINGDFNIWQRGTSFLPTSAAAIFSADRWRNYNNGTGVVTVSQQTFTPGAAPVAGYEGTYFHRIAYDASLGTTTTHGFAQRIENVQTAAGQTITISFWAKLTNSQASAVSSINVRQNFGSGGSTQVTTTGTAPSLTTSWARYSTTVAVPSISGKTIGTSSYVEIDFIFNAQASQNIDLWGFQVELGSVATAFQTATGTLQGELAACQYYFNRLAGEGTFQQISNGQCWSSTEAMATVNYPIMRVAPTITYSTASFFSLQNATNTEVAITALASYNIRKTSYKPNMTVASGLVAGNATLFQTRSTGTIGTLDLSAEL
jgi:hypothetical protein